MQVQNSKCLVSIVYSLKIVSIFIQIWSQNCPKIIDEISKKGKATERLNDIKQK